MTGTPLFSALCGSFPSSFSAFLTIFSNFRCHLGIAGGYLELCATVFKSFRLGNIVLTWNTCPDGGNKTQENAKDMKKMELNFLPR